MITVTEAPFLLSRLGWGYFDVTMDVEFQPWTGIKPLTMVHELCFENLGKTRSILLDVSGEEKETAKILAKEMEKIKLKNN